VILADTSVWVDHLRAENREMRNQLAQGRIVMHSVIIAELALGSLRDRTKTLALLDRLPQVKLAHLHEVRLMIESRHLYSLGIGLIDAELIASIFINSPTLLWTHDKRLRKVAHDLGIHANLP
jgi:predicted nucleic acid-binding protein